MQQELFNFWSAILQILAVLFQVLTAGGLIYFAWRQTQINKRMQELADYVAVSLIPDPNGQLQLQIMNVGRSNLYLHKWEVGSISETLVKPWLLPTESKSKIIIGIQPPQIGQHLAKFYLTDENNQKYLSTGEVSIDPVGFQLPTLTTPPQTQDNIQNQTAGSQAIVNVQLRMRAWSYKTEKTDWTI